MNDDIQATIFDALDRAVHDNGTFSPNRPKPRKQLIHRQTVPEGTAIVIHNKKSGNPRLEIVKPPKKARKARKNRSG